MLLLENLRFHKDEEKNDPNFAAQLAKLGDVYVNDAFGTAHREHASTFGVPQLLQGKPRVDRVPDPEGTEVPRRSRQQRRSGRSSRSSAGRRSPTRSTSSSSSSSKADTLLIGGAMAYTFFLAQGKEVGKSLVERDKVDLAKSLLAKAGGKIKLPVDTVISDKMTDDAQTKVVEGNIPADMEGFDIGPKTTAELYAAEIAKAKTVIWNGPMGVFEKKPFAGRHEGGRRGGGRRDAARTARRRSSAAATAPRRSSSWAWPTRSATSAPAAGRRWSSSRTATSRRWISWTKLRRRRCSTAVMLSLSAGSNAFDST